MTAIIAILDEQWVHIWTDSREWSNRRKSDSHTKCKILWEKIIYACSWYSSIMDSVERFYSERWDFSIEDDVLLKLREYINTYCDEEYWVIISDWTIIKTIEKDLLRHEKEYIWWWSWGLQAMSAFIALWNTNDYQFDYLSERHIKNSIKTAIQMDIWCWWEAKYYFLKNPDGK